MEEILASIRRIIADDQIAKAEVVPPRRPPRRCPRTTMCWTSPRSPSRPQTHPPRRARDRVRKEPIEDGQIDFDAISFDDDEPDLEPLPPLRAAPPIEPPRPVPQPASREPDPEPTPTERLTSAVTDASVAQAFHMLSNKVMSSQARTPGRPRAGYAPPHAEGLARREPARHGRAPGSRRDRARGPGR